MDIFYYIFDHVFKRKKKKIEEQAMTEEKKEEVTTPAEPLKTEQTIQQETPPEPTDPVKEEPMPTPEISAEDIEKIKEEIRTDTDAKLKNIDDKLTSVSEKLSNVQGPPEGFNQKLIDIEKKMEQYDLLFHEVGTNRINPFIDKIDDAVEEPPVKKKAKREKPIQEEPEEIESVPSIAEQPKIEIKTKIETASEQVQESVQKEPMLPVQVNKSEELNMVSDEPTDLIPPSDERTINEELQSKINELLQEHTGGIKRDVETIVKPMEATDEVEKISEYIEEPFDGTKEKIQVYDAIKDETQSVAIDKQVDSEDFDEIDHEKITVERGEEKDGYTDEKFTVEHSIRLPENESRVRGISQKIQVEESVEKDKENEILSAELEKLEKETVKNLLKKLKEIRSMKQKIEHTDKPKPKKTPAIYGKKLKEDQYFKVVNGEVIKDFPELLRVVEGMDPGSFSYHVNDSRNDFASWIEHAFKNKKLAKKLDAAKNKKDFLKVLMTA